MSDDNDQELAAINQELNDIGQRAVALKGLKRKIQFERELDRLAQLFSEHIARVLCFWLLNRVEVSLEATKGGVLDKVNSLREGLYPDNLLASWQHAHLTSFSDVNRFSNFNRKVSDEIARGVLEAAVQLYHQNNQWPTVEVVVTEEGKPVIRIA